MALDKTIDGEFKEHEDESRDSGTLAIAVRAPVELGILRDPSIVIEEARKAAEALAQVIKAKPKPVKFNGEQYLEAEDWTLLGQFYGVVPQTQWTREIKLDGARGWEARVLLLDLRTGVTVGGAEAMCLDSEENWGTRPKYDWMDLKVAQEKFGQDKIIETQASKYGKGLRAKVLIGEEQVADASRRSMAQTRATSRALAMRFKWIPVLAGFKTTPAEDLPRRGGGPEYADEDPGPPSDVAPKPAADAPKSNAVPAEELKARAARELATPKDTSGAMTAETRASVDKARERANAVGTTAAQIRLKGWGFRTWASFLTDGSALQADEILAVLAGEPVTA